MKTIDVRRGEWRSLAWAAGWFFCVLAAYYTIRPVRETFASELSRNHRANLFVGTLVVMLLATPIYGWVASRFVGRRLATCVYGFFCLNLIVFWALLSADNPAPWVGGAFFVWISVFNLFVVTLFWGTVVDLFTGEQGKRLFGVIASAGTFGQLVASWAVRGAAERLGAENLLWISCGLLAAAIVCAHQLWRDRPDPTPRLAADASGEATWSAAWEGALTVLRSPYLGGIALLLVGLSIAATSVYFQMTDLASEAIPDRDQRTAWFASINEWHGYLTLILQATAASYLLRTVGVAATLALTPLIYAGGFAALSITQALAVLAAFQVALRVASFAFGGPALEVLYTAVAPRQKYRAKAFIDTVGKRTGDVLGGKLYAGLRAFGWAPTSIALLLLPATLALAGLCFVLGDAYQQAAKIKRQRRDRGVA